MTRRSMAVIALVLVALAVVCAIVNPALPINAMVLAVSAVAVALVGQLLP